MNRGTCRQVLFPPSSPADVGLRSVDIALNNIARGRDYVGQSQPVDLLVRLYQIKYAAAAFQDKVEHFLPCVLSRVGERCCVSLDQVDHVDVVAHARAVRG